MSTWIHNHYELVTVVLPAVTILITILIAWLQLRKKEPSSTGLRQSRIDNSAVISGSNNQVVLTQSTGVLKKAATKKAERPSPNLVFAGGKRKLVYVSPQQNDGICDPRTEDQRGDSLEAFVLKFENRRIDREIGRARNVIAKLKFQHKNGPRFRDIDYGVWLNSPCNSTDIGIGDTEELVLIGGLGQKYVTYEDKRRDNLIFEGTSYVKEDDVEDYEQVEITLIDKDSQAVLVVKLKVWRQGGSICHSEL